MQPAAQAITALIDPPPTQLTIQQAIADAITRLTSREFLLAAGSWLTGLLLALRDPTSELAMVLLAGMPPAFFVARTAQKSNENKEATKVQVAQYDALKTVINSAQ